ncbi:hypothetical protein H6P81_013820 [Aristolochia fimbriata]|uniref:Uncharacterized protein n=1 Tax=Aristolochia fimbriata TaxID=158543 RepID=A0AAV7EJ19_ARIFI|nr:hypothetical protein H6P81_013820 [Aristolochia fimbriata]
METNNVQSLLEAIRDSEVIENRIDLLNQLRDSNIVNKSDLVLLAECLVSFWEDSACMPQGMLNKSILHITRKYADMNMSICLSHFLALGVKVSVWCGKNLLIEESLDENFVFQIIMEASNFFSTTWSVLISSNTFSEQEILCTVESFILEQLSLTTVLISGIKRVSFIASDILKLAQVVLDSSVKLCKAYSAEVKWGIDVVTVDEHLTAGDERRLNSVKQVINIIVCTISNLYKLGTIAASGGGSLVSILNISWKGVVSLLQLGNGTLADKVSIGDIILTLLSLATASLRSVAGAWSSMGEKTLDVAEAKRTFLPIKFYLINVVRICSQYPSQALRLFKEVTLCVLMVSTFGTSLTKESYLKAASTTLAEFLEPTSFLLLLNLLNSAELKHEAKLPILDWLFTDETCSGTEEISSVGSFEKISLDEIFTVECESMPRSKVLRLGRFVLFLSLLRSSPYLREEVVLGISKKLGCFLELLMKEDVYSSVLVLHIPVINGSGAMVELAWKPMFPYVVHTLKTFMTVAAATAAWTEVELFLFTNFFHPHFLCWEIVIELWCFFIQNAETQMVDDIFDGLCSLFKSVATTASSLAPFSASRRMARSLCVVLMNGSQFLVDHFYNSVACDGKSQLSSIMLAALFMEGFPINLLSDDLRKLAIQRVTTDFCVLVENDAITETSLSSSVSHGGLAVCALSALLPSVQTSGFDIGVKNFSRVLKFMLAVMHGYRSSNSSSYKEHYSKLLSQTLEIISNTKHLYASDNIVQVVLELKTLFSEGPSASDIWLHQCKPALASFLAGLSHMEIVESDDCMTTSAIWELYHLLLRERHWALVHLALSSFGYFAARTTCNQLWRFVPSDAALSLDTETGKEANEELFMTELKVFLEKERALVKVTLCDVELSFLSREGRRLNQAIEKLASCNMEVAEGKVVQIDKENSVKKKRKLPGEVHEGVALLQRGVKVMSGALARWSQLNNGSKALHDELANGISSINGVVSHLAGLTDMDEQ